MSLIPGWYPPSRENWELVVHSFKLFPLVVALPQWFSTWAPYGKTSTQSRLNLPGKWAWMIMELPGLLTVLYCMWALPKQEGLRGLPGQNWAMAAMYSVHYVYRGPLSALVLNPSMSPIHLVVFLMAFAFNIANGLSIGGWLAGYGPTTQEDWNGRALPVVFGVFFWMCGLFGNIYHDEELREIRREALSKQKAQAKKEGKPISGVQKHYELPENGLFEFILYPHYFCEWIEWTGFWMIGGWACLPARTFLFNELASMTPRAVQGKQWYVEKFGKDKVGSRKAVIPGLI